MADTIINGGVPPIPHRAQPLQCGDQILAQRKTKWFIEVSPSW